MNLDDLLFLGDLSQQDAQVQLLIAMEEARQVEKLIMIPSESIAPPAVRQALGSVFTNIYAEGYPALRTLRGDPNLLTDCAYQLAYHCRYADRRFYKGTELVDIIETLAQKRVARLFANPKAPEDHIFANVQPLSGAAANNAVYEALVDVGDPIMGMDLTHGGHLTHGSPYNRSGKYHRVYPYGVNPATGRLDYEAIRKIAKEVRPKMIVAGASAYPWTIDWTALRHICDEVGAYLLADIAHPAGLVVAGLFPNPVGTAHVTTFTTHKTMIGPRAAVILTTDEEIAKRIDRAIFPGEQGGPHINKIAAMAVCFQIATTPAFRRLQERIVENAKAMAEALKARGIRLAYGGTDTHMFLIDLNGIDTKGAFPIKGDVASRILDICGLVCNKNTIPGDLNAAYSSALRFGTTWVTQRGLGVEDMEEIADTVADVLYNLRSFSYIGTTGDIGRAKAPLAVLQRASERFRALAQKAAAEPIERRREISLWRSQPPEPDAAILIVGERARAFLHEASTANILALEPGHSITTRFLDEDGNLIDEATVWRLTPNNFGCDRFIVLNHRADRLFPWLKALSDGYVLFDKKDIYRKIEGPVIVTPCSKDQAQTLLAEVLGAESRLPAAANPTVTTVEDSTKPYYIGRRQSRGSANSKTEWHWNPDPKAPLRRTPLYNEHLKLKGKIIPFAGWEMPVWYTAISDEHAAVRQAAGLFDVAHMGVLEVAGPGATRFLDLVTTNYVPALRIGQSQYSYLLDPDGNVLDDILIYRREAERYLIVVNAVNQDKDLAWLQAVNSQQVLIDRENPDCQIEQPVLVRSLKAEESGPDQRIDIALQGPRSLDIALRCVSPPTGQRLRRLRRGEFLEDTVDGIPALISRTGYTGEEIGLEFYVHPDNAVALWNLLLDRGADLGVKPCGLGARDSTRTEAGLPLYGHELAGEHNINPIEAGYGAFVKLHKPFFIGRAAMVRAAEERRREIVRFQMKEKGVRAVRSGFPVVSARGVYAGVVTSCTLVEGVQTGMALVDRAYAREGTPLFIFPLPHDGKAPPEKPKSELGPGDKVLLADAAVVVSRFPLRKTE